MTNNSSFVRKISYGLCMAMLLIPLYMISRPPVRNKDGLSQGGYLSQMRSKYELSQADLGEIDPASETMKLATLGMRGVASNLLWERANRYKVDGDWDNLAATLNQISKLQPNFLSVWQFQGWNLAYNVSVEFDDYHTRYEWVKRGLKYLRDGIRYNTREPVLPWEIGWTMGHKIGKADEYVQYRRLFRQDNDFHEELRANINIENTRGADNRPDNWLAGREWLLRAQQLVDSGIDIRGRLVDETSGIRRGKTPLIFHSHPPKWLMSFAAAIEEEGYLDEKAQFAWQQGGRDWAEFGQREIPTSYGFTIRLNDEERVTAEAADYGKKLDELLPGVRQTIEDERRNELSPDELYVLNTPREQLTFEQSDLASSVARKIKARYAEIGERAPADKRREARRLVRQGSDAEEMVDAIINYRAQINFDYWKMRCDVEQLDTTLRARKLVYEADRAFRASDLVTAKERYELAWNEWAQVFEKFPKMMEDTTAEELMDAVRVYKKLLDQLDEAFPPADFKLMKLIEIQSKLLEQESR